MCSVDEACAYLFIFISYKATMALPFAFSKV